MVEGKAQSGQQTGDPAKLARALVAIASEEPPPPHRFTAGADAIALVEQKVVDLKAEIDAYRDLSTSLAFDELESAGSATWIAMRATVMCGTRRRFGPSR